MMAINIPEEVYTMKTKRSIVKANAVLYHKAGRKLKTQILKDEYKLKHKYRPHPHASVLKKKIPVETNFNKVRGKLGYTELDTVHHCAESTQGSYCLTLSEVEINTHWTELQSIIILSQR